MTKCILLLIWLGSQPLSVVILHIVHFVPVPVCVLMGMTSSLTHNIILIYRLLSGNMKSLICCTFSQFAGLLSGSSRQDLGQHAFSLHARLTCCCTANATRPRRCLGAWNEKKENGDDNWGREQRERWEGEILTSDNVCSVLVWSSSCSWHRSFQILLQKIGYNSACCQHCCHLATRVLKYLCGSLFSFNLNCFLQQLDK